MNLGVVLGHDFVWISSALYVFSVSRRIRRLSRAQLRRWNYPCACPANLSLDWYGIQKSSVPFWSVWICKLANFTLHIYIYKDMYIYIYKDIYIYKSAFYPICSGHGWFCCRWTRGLVFTQWHSCLPNWTSLKVTSPVESRNIYIKTIFATEWGVKPKIPSIPATSSQVRTTTKKTILM
jgi:hypothetical protein